MGEWEGLITALQAAQRDGTVADQIRALAAVLEKVTAAVVGVMAIAADGVELRADEASEVGE